MPTTTPQERAENASAARSKHARRRRFARYVAEMARNPEDLDKLTKIKLAETLHAGGGWIVFEDH